MILKNRRTREKLEIEYPEFRKKFAKEIQFAFESFYQTENNKFFFKINQNLDTDFYFNLQWNFNHFGNSVWYIERI